jgi:hypothetical protein
MSHEDQVGGTNFEGPQPDPIAAQLQRLEHGFGEAASEGGIVPAHQFLEDAHSRTQPVSIQIGVDEKGQRVLTALAINHAEHENGYRDIWRALKLAREDAQTQTKSLETERLQLKKRISRYRSIDLADTTDLHSRCSDIEEALRGLEKRIDIYSSVQETGPVSALIIKSTAQTLYEGIAYGFSLMAAQEFPDDKALQEERVDELMTRIRYTQPGAEKE